MKNFDFCKLMAGLIIAAIILYSLFGCNTARIDDNNVNKAILRHPEQTAKQLNDWKPCIPLVTKSDSTLYKQYLADLENMRQFYNKIPDTVSTHDTLMEVWADTSKIKFYKRKYNEGQQQIKYLNIYIDKLNELCAGRPPIHDTIPVDGPKLFIVAKQLEGSEKEKAALQKQCDSKQHIINWMLILLLLMGVYCGYKIYSFFSGGSTIGWATKLFTKK